MSTREHERDALLPSTNLNRTPNQPARRTIFPRSKAHPYWLLPLVLIVYLCRGATYAPRIQVYRTIACRNLYHTDNILSVDCSGPDVQARAARIQAAVTTSMNILSAITTGFWSRLGDSHGRRLIIAMFFIGSVGMDFVHVLVTKPQSFMGRYPESLVLIGPILEGLVGATPTFDGVVHAYTSDCTPHGSRSKIFSTIQGIVFVGSAVGPWFSGLVLPRSTALNVDSAFYMSISLLLSTLLYVLFVFPDSQKSVAREESLSTAPLSRTEASPLVLFRRQVDRFISSLFIPLTVFKPRMIPGHPSRKNYNLTIIGAASFIYFACISIINIRFLYSQLAYNWTTAQLGYFMSLLWAIKAINLLIVFPFLISCFKPRPPPLGSGQSSEHLVAELLFDKRLTLYSVGLDCFADLLITIAPTAPQGGFIFLSSVSSFASGGVPALSSLSAVCLHAAGSETELGSLFGGTAVLSAVAHIISPTISAIVYGSTVALFPKAIFALCAALLGSVVLLVNGVRGRREDIAISPVDQPDREDLVQPSNPSRRDGADALEESNI